MSSLGWIVLVIVVLLLVGLVAVLGRKRQQLAQQQRGRETAASLREKGTESALDARAREAEAARQQAEAEKVKIEAERMQQKAQQTQSEAEDIRGRAGDDLRTADEVDPDVEARGHRLGKDDQTGDPDRRDDIG